MRRFVLALLIVAGVVPVLGASPCAAATGGRRAAVLVQFSNGETKDFCVAFTAAEDKAGFTGAQLLERTGLNVVFGGTSSAATVCKIDAEGCDDTHKCFCACPVATAPSCRFWGYYTINSSGRWTFQQVGASSRIVHDGDVDAWVFGNHNGGRGMPATTTFKALCGRARRVAAAEEPAKKSRKSAVGVGIAAGVFAGFALGVAMAMRRRRESH